MKVLLATAILLLASLVAFPTQADSSAVQPGDLVEVAGAQCTLSFIYDGAGDDTGKTFASLAAHCVGGVGDAASTPDFANFGTVVFVGDASGTVRDFALIEVAEGVPVNAQVRGHPGFPTGVATAADTEAGDLVLMSGWGLAWRPTQQTREDRVGVLVTNDGAIAQLVGPVMQGDSGGPWMTSDGKALALVSKIITTLSVTCCPPDAFGLVGQEGPTISGLIADAAAHGFDIALRTA